ncbi:MAG TPA: acyl-CoA dehydrogenase family protein [Nocardioidaceae bacterium]|nr:acyl-CoA dehydrogenase family protein [Nocardioidaceae bacterium]
MERTFFEVDHEAFAETVREFVAREAAPNYLEWEKAGIIEKAVWAAAGKQGILGLSIPEVYGGAGVEDYRFRVAMMEQMCAGGVTSLAAGFNTQEDIVVPYLLDLGTEEQKHRWLPKMASGESIGAIAMTEPGAGSDLQGMRATARLDGDEWVLNGQKTFITNGIHADVVIVVARTDPSAGSRGFSLLVVEEGMPGFSRGRNLEKVGLHAQDTAELSFTDVRIPAANVLGDLGAGFVHLMERLPRERLSIAVFALASAQAAFDCTYRYCFERTAFGAPIGDLQNTRFVLAEIATELDVMRTYVDHAVLALNAGTLTAVDAAKAKWWASELQNRIVDRCVQLHGGYGYMLEYPIARAFVDSRVQTIYGGTSEVMKEIIGRDLAAAAKRGAAAG